MESKSSSPRAPVFGRKGAISPGQSGTFGSFDRAKAGKFAGEFTETIQNDSPLKRFLSSSIVELLTFGGNCLHFRAKPAHISGSFTTTLYQKLQLVLSEEFQIPLVIKTQRRPGPKHIPYGIPPDQRPIVLQRVLENHESYRNVASDYGVSRETIRRLVRASKKAS